jgi:peptide chain release factor 3
LHDRLEIMDRADRNKVAGVDPDFRVDDPKLAEHIPADLLAKFHEELEMARELLPAFDRKAFLEGR